MQSTFHSALKLTNPGQDFGKPIMVALGTHCESQSGSETAQKNHSFGLCPAA